MNIQQKSPCLKLDFRTKNQRFKLFRFFRTFRIFFERFLACLISESVGDLVEFLKIAFSNIFVRQIFSRRRHRVEQQLLALRLRVSQHQEPNYVFRHFAFRQRTCPPFEIKNAS